MIGQGSRSVVSALALVAFVSAVPSGAQQPRVTYTEQRVFEIERTGAAGSSAELRNLKLDIVTYDGENDPERVQGEMIFSEGYSRSFDRPLYDHVTAGERAERVSSASDMAGRAYEAENQIIYNANENFEVIFDYATNTRYIIDHVRQEIVEEPLVDAPNVPTSILADAAARDPRAAAALGNLLGSFTRPRLNPRFEFTLGRSTGESRVLIINRAEVGCDYFEFENMGGPIGKVCLADISEHPQLSYLRDVMVQYPLEASTRNDPISQWRRLIEAGGSGRFPVSYNLHVAGLEDDDLTIDMLGANGSERNLDREIFEPPSGYKRLSLSQ